jgi:hypothetical protein
MLTEPTKPTITNQSDKWPRSSIYSALCHPQERTARLLNFNGLERLSEEFPKRETFAHSKREGKKGKNIEPVLQMFQGLYPQSFLCSW